MSIGVGAAAIPISPDLSDFGRELAVGINRQLRRRPAKVDVVPDVAGLDRALRAAADDLTVDLQADTSRVEQQLRTATGDVTADVDLDTAGLRAELQQAAGSVDTDVDIDVSGVRSKLASAAGTIRPDVQLDTGDISRQVSGAVEDGFDGVGGGAAGGGLGAGLAGGLATKLGPVAAIGGAAAVAFGSGFSQTLEREDVDQRLLASLTITPERAAELGDVAGDLYAQAWGDSLGATGQAVQDTVEIAGDLGDALLTKAVPAAMDLSDVLGEDFRETVRAAQTLVENGLVGSLQEGLDELADAGAGGLNRAQDLLETVIEYSGPLSDLGLSVDEIFDGLGGSIATGTRDLDKVADSLKEFRVLALEERGLKAAEMLGIDGESLQAAVAEGGPASRDALLSVLDTLRAESDPLVQELAGRDLFGSMFEDARDGVLAFDPLTDAIGDTADAATQLSDDLNNKLSTRIESLKRGALSNLTDFVEGRAVPAIEDLWDTFDDEGVEGVVAGVMDGIAAEVDGGLSDLPDFTTWVGDGLDTATAAFPQLASGLLDRVKATAPEIGDQVATWATEFTEWVGPAAAELGPKLGEFTGTMANWFVTEALPAVGEGFDAVAEGFVSWVFDDVVPQLPAALEGVTGIFTGFFDGLAGEIDEGLAKMADRVGIGRGNLQAALASLPGGALVGQVIGNTDRNRSSGSGGRTRAPAPGPPPNALATGGAVARPTLAIVGDNTDSKPEIVSPVPLMREALRAELAGGMGGGGFSIENFNVVTRDDPDVIFRTATQKLQLAAATYG